MRCFARHAVCVFGLILIATASLGGCGNGGDGPGGTGGNGGTGGTMGCDGPEDCDDLNDCTEDSCNLADGSCDHTALGDGTECSLDGLPGVCSNGRCEPAGLCNGVDCDDENDCTVDICNPVDGLCQHRTAADGASCDFGDRPGLCRNGRCEDAMLCLGVDCDDENECTLDSCDPQDGTCDHTLVNDETPCAEDQGTCQEGSCVAEFACDEQGIRDAIEVGGGPHTFACNGPTIITTENELIIDKDVILDGEGNLTVDGAGTHRVFQVRWGQPIWITAELHGFGVTGGGGVDNGTGILNNGILTLTNTSVRDNTAGNANPFGSGGGIYNGGTLVLNNSAVSENTSLGDGGGIYNAFGAPPEERSILTLIESTVSGNTADSEGGGIYNEGILTLTNSTVSGNTAEDGAGVFNVAGESTLDSSTVSENSAASDGGGIVNYQADLTLTNSTVSGNVALDLGGGIFNRTQASLTITNSTLSGNDADFGNAIFFFQSGETAVANTIIDGACNLARVTSGGHNIESPGDSCGFSPPLDQVAVTAMLLNLGPLQDNGGLTLTQAPEPPSDAIDVIDLEDCVDADGQPVMTDQRGIERPQGAACDVGAVEVAPGP